VYIYIYIYRERERERESTNEGKRGTRIGYSWERDHWENQDGDGWILERERERGCDGVYWIGLAQDRDKWRALVNSVLNLQVR
jgi:hypothetical protein